ncbi:tRNA dihydrouridine synthase [Halodesulfovibrio aestuarii]|uniref:tRNA-dihydrouridine synthase n=1 Tax=Halodesulfovibrio aestuarii TaxID=126333 RepID=A0A8G2C945_9BACT|nr:tRNA-dihydrouridine synthase family protein [Halodesulfovibrio aestuarii]SHJ03584.1 putative TIM-barrel protein, nifR3 family [Halodesulfovibrio aestuarii]
MHAAESFSAPITLRGRTIENRLCLAPMAGLGHIAYRAMAAHYGGYGLLFTGMCSARAVPTENRHKSPVFNWQDEELPTLVCQLFGAAPDDMAIAAERIQEENFFGVDINMGCSVSPIVDKQCGADLMRDVDRACEMVEKMRKVIDIPLFVKFRTGWQNEPEPAVAFARMLEQAGADALTFHPRVAPDRRTRRPRIDDIRLVKEAVSIPVFGNGDVWDAASAQSMVERTGCDGLAIGRAAISKPWIFAELTRGFEPTPETYKETLFMFLDQIEKWYDPTRAIKLYKKYCMFFAANFSYGNRLFGQLIAGNSMEKMRENAERCFGDKIPQISKSLNSLMMNR